MGRIILEGFMGSGKSTYGRILSKEFLLPFLDTDEEIERIEGCSINEIFKEKGEEYFRNAETGLLEELSASGRFKDGVISVGGGMPVREKNRELMRMCGSVVYIKASAESLKERLRRGKDKRPMLKGGDLDNIVDALLSEREDSYISAAHYVIETDGLEMYQVVNELKQIYNNRRKPLN